MDAGTGVCNEFDGHIESAIDSALLEKIKDRIRQLADEVVERIGLDVQSGHVARFHKPDPRLHIEGGFYDDDFICHDSAPGKDPVEILALQRGGAQTRNR